MIKKDVERRITAGLAKASKTHEIVAYIASAINEGFDPEDLVALWASFNEDTRTVLTKEILEGAHFRDYTKEEKELGRALRKMIQFRKFYGVDEIINRLIQAVSARHPELLREPSATPHSS